MVRVAGLHDQIDAGVERPSVDGSTPAQTLEHVRERVLEDGLRLQRCVSERLLPALASTTSLSNRWRELGEADREALVRPLPPRHLPGVDATRGRPRTAFPYISNLSLSLARWSATPTPGTRPSRG